MPNHRIDKAYLSYNRGLHEVDGFYGAVEEAAQELVELLGAEAGKQIQIDISPDKTLEVRYTSSGKEVDFAEADTDIQDACQRILEIANACFKRARRSSSPSLHRRTVSHQRLSPSRGSAAATTTSSTSPTSRRRNSSSAAMGSAAAGFGDDQEPTQFQQQNTQRSDSLDGRQLPFAGLNQTDAQQNLIEDSPSNTHSASRRRNSTSPFAGSATAGSESNQGHTQPQQQNTQRRDSLGGTERLSPNLHQQDQVADNGSSPSPTLSASTDDNTSSAAGSGSGQELNQPQQENHLGEVQQQLADLQTTVDQLRAQMQDAQTQHQQRLADLAEQHAQEKAQADAQNGKALEEATAAIQQQLAQLHHSLDTQQKDFASEMDKTREAHARDLEALRAQYGQGIKQAEEQAKQEGNNALKTLAASYAEAVAALKQRHAEALAAKSDHYSEQLIVLCVRHNRFVLRYEELVEAYNKLVMELQQRQQGDAQGKALDAQTLASLKAELADLANEKEYLSQEMRAMQSQFGVDLAQLTKICAAAQAKIAQLAAALKEEQYQHRATQSQYTQLRILHSNCPTQVNNTTSTTAATATTSSVSKNATSTSSSGTTVDLEARIYIPQQQQQTPPANNNAGAQTQTAAPPVTGPAVSAAQKLERGVQLFEAFQKSMSSFKHRHINKDQTYGTMLAVPLKVLGRALQRGDEQEIVNQLSAAVKHQCNERLFEKMEKIQHGKPTDFGKIDRAFKKLQNHFAPKAS